MGGKSQPDMNQLTSLQGEENRAVITDQTNANRPDQTTPWGYTTWDSTPYLDPATGEMSTKWAQTTGLTPELQDILNKQIAIQSGRSDVAGGLTDRMASEFGQAMDFGNLSPMGNTPYAQYTMPESYEGIADVGDPARLRERAENAYMGKATSRLDDQYGGKRQQLEMQMRNQGLGPEDAAWQSRMRGLGQQETDAYGQAQYDAIRAGLGEQSQLFGQDMGMRQQGVNEANNQFSQALGSNAQNFGQNLQSSNYANQIRQQQMTEAMQQRGFSLNEINALLSGQQVGTPQMPNFSNAGAAQPVDYVGAGVAESSAKNAASPWGGVADLAGTLGGAYLGTL